MKVPRAVLGGRWDAEREFLHSRHGPDLELPIPDNHLPGAWAHLKLSGDGQHVTYLSAGRVQGAPEDAPARNDVELVSIDPETPPVRVTGNGAGRRPGIRFLRVAPFDDDEVTVADRVPVTPPTRRLVDVAGMLGSREVEVAASVGQDTWLQTAPELLSHVIWYAVAHGRGRDPDPRAFR